MDNLNILLKYLVNSDDVSKIADKAEVETSVVEKVCVSIFDCLIPSDFSRCEGSHLEKKDLNKITSNFNKLLSGDELKKIIKDVALDQAEEQSRVAVVVKEVLSNVRGRLQYMTAVKKKPVEDVKPVKQEAKLVEEKEETIEHKTLAKAIEEDVKEDAIANDVAKSIKETVKPKEGSKHKGLEQKGFEKKEFESPDDEQLSMGEKIAIGVVGALLVAVIVIIIVILFKVIK